MCPDSLHDPGVEVADKDDGDAVAEGEHKQDVGPGDEQCCYLDVGN